MSAFPKVVVATLTWNQKEHVLECLESLVKLDYPNYEIVVVDNGSSDGTSEAVRLKFPQLSVVRHTENLGCAEGVNGEIRFALQAKADFLFIIANDAKVEPQTLTELVRVAEKYPAAGMFFPKVYYWGREAVPEGGSEKQLWYARGTQPQEIDWWRGRFTGFIQNVEDDKSYDTENEALLYPGGFCLVRIEAIKKTGFLEPGYFIFYDDADWFYRMYRAGYVGRFAPKAKTWHKPSSSVGRESESFYYYRTRNRLMFFQKYSPRGIFPFFLAYFFYESLHAVYGLWRSGMNASARGLIFGIFDYFRGKQGSREFGSRIPLLLRRTLGRQKIMERIESSSFGVTVRRIFPIRLARPNAASEERDSRIKISIHINWNLGDEIMMIPAYEALKQKYPDSVVEAHVRYPELLEGNPFVDRVNPEKPLIPDLTFDLHEEVKGKSRLRHLQDILKVESLALPRLYLKPEEIEQSKIKWGLNGRPLIGVTPTARWFSRKWGREKWIELVEAFTREWGAEVLVLGKDEAPLPVGRDLIGKTGVREAALLLKQCSLFVGSDSGLVHLALAAGTPTVGLYGPLDPSYLVQERPTFLPLWTNLECRGCWSDSRMTYPDHCPKIVPDCMESISVPQVLAASRKLLSPLLEMSR